MNTLILILKGFFIGIAKIIPGVSGALLAITFNLYEQGLNAITNFFDNKKKNFKFLLTVGIGIAIGIFFFSRVVSYFFLNHYFITMLFFIGLISGGIKELVKSEGINNYFVFLVAFILIILIANFSINNNSNSNNIVLFFISGIVDALATIVPGISGTALLMLLGVYDNIINAIGNITNINLTVNNLGILIPYSIGMLVGIIIFAKLMNYLFNKYKANTFSFIIGISLSTIIILIINTFKVNFNIFELLLGILALFIGYFISKKLDTK